MTVGDINPAAQPTALLGPLDFERWQGHAVIGWDFRKGFRSAHPDRDPRAHPLALAGAPRPHIFPPLLRFHLFCIGDNVGVHPNGRYQRIKYIYSPAPRIEI